MDIQTEYQPTKRTKKRKENGSWRNKNKSKINDIKKYKQPTKISSQILQIKEMKEIRIFCVL